MTHVIVGMVLITIMKLSIFIIGYLTIKLGKELLVEGVKGEFKFTGDVAGTKATLQSASPGLLFVLLGIMLIGYGIYVDKTILVEESLDSATLQQLEQDLSQAPIPGK